MNNDYTNKMDIRIGRLEKKIRKLQEQRDHYRKEMEFRDRILEYYPYATRSFEERQERIKNMEELRMLRVRVKEQELLIERMLNEKA